MSLPMHLLTKLNEAATTFAPKLACSAEDRALNSPELFYRTNNGQRQHVPPTMHSLYQHHFFSHSVILLSFFFFQKELRFFVLFTHRNLLSTFMITYSFRRKKHIFHLMGYHRIYTLSCKSIDTPIEISNNDI